MEIVSEAFLEFTRSQPLPSAPAPFRQHAQLRAAIDKLRDEARRGPGGGGGGPAVGTAEGVGAEPTCAVVLPRRRMNFDEVSQIVEGHLHLESSSQGTEHLGPEQIQQNALNERKTIISKIEAILEEVNRTAAAGGTPKLLIRNQALWSNCVYDMERVTLKALASAKKKVVTYTGDRCRFNTIILVLTRARELLMRNLTCTRRELYYQHVSRLASQASVDVAVRDACCLLDAPPWALGLSATGKGLVAGPLAFVTREGATVHCTSAGGTLVPQDVVGIRSFKTTAKYILVVEKDAIFQKLLDEGALERLGPLILITGKGYPDVSTRQLLCRLTSELRLPALALVDADPHGLDIFLTYKYGSLAQSHIAASLACGRLALLGVRTRDVLELAPTAARLPLTARDVRVLHALLARPYLTAPHGSRLAAEARAALQAGCKAELESVAALAAAYLTDTYLPARLIAGDFIA